MSSKRPKILIATGIFPPSVGGPATYSKLLLDELPKRDIDTKVLSFDEVRKYPKGIRHMLYFLKLLKRARGMTHIYAQDPVSVGLPSSWAAFLLRKKFFIRVAGDYAWEQSVQRYGVEDSIDDFQERTYDARVERLRAVQKKVVGRADKVITPSEYFRDLVQKWSPRTKVVTIYNGISFPELDPAKKKGEFSLISAGRLVPWKGFKELIEIVAGLIRDGYGMSLTILGDGPQRGTLEEVVKKEGMEQRVTLLGSVDREEMFSQLSSSDVFVLNTSFESFSFQVVEAMYAGLPVITNNTGSLPELVRNGEEGFLCPVGDTESMKGKILQLYNDKELRQEMAIKGKKRSQKFSIENTLKKLIEELKT